MLKIINGIRVIQYNMQTDKQKAVAYNLWKSFYILDNKVNLNEIIYTRVVKDKFIQITYGKLLELGESFPYLGQHIQRISMKAFYTGRNPRKKYAELLDNTLNREYSELYKIL